MGTPRLHRTGIDEALARLAEFDAVMRMRERTEFPAEILGRLPRLKLILA